LLRRPRIDAPRRSVADLLLSLQIQARQYLAATFLLVANNLLDDFVETNASHTIPQINRYYGTSALAQSRNRCAMV
jgi:hypothetical protein